MPIDSDSSRTYTNGISRLMLGSDASEVVRSGPTPVLLMRGNGEGHAARQA
jgi:hypothetical protein